MRLAAFLTERPLLCLSAVFAVLACLSVVGYFTALRPRRGTTEWITRFQAPRGVALSRCALRWADALWALPAVLAAALLRMFGLLLGQERASDPLRFLSEHVRQVAGALALCAALAAALYLLLRILFGKPFPALLSAALCGILPVPEAGATALLAWSLLCLYQWAAAPYDAPFFRRALWLLPCGLLYAAALLCCWPTIWFGPFYLGVYLTTQVRRWYGGTPGKRGKRLALSLFLTLTALSAGTVFLWLAYCFCAALVTDPLAALRSGAFYRALLPTLAEKLTAFFRQPPLLGEISGQKLLLLLAGVAASLPLLHGACVRRDSRCLWLLCLLPCGLCAWLLGGVPLLTLPLLLALGWTFYLYNARNHPAYAVFCVCATALFFGVRQILL